jgi:HEAT repeat protein
LHINEGLNGIFLYFLSTDSSEFVRNVQKRINESGKGFIAWIDDNLKLGGNWKIAIDTAIDGSEGVIVVVTPKSLDSQYVTYEWAYALGKGKLVIPVTLEYPDPDPKKKQKQIHPKLSDLQKSDFTKDNDLAWNELLQNLESIHRQLDKPLEIANAERGLSDYSSEARRKAIDALNHINHPSAIEVFVRAFESYYEEVASFAAVGVARKTGCKDNRALPILEKSLMFKETRKEAAEHLAKYNNSQAVQILHKTLFEIQDYERDPILDSLTRIQDIRVIPMLESLLTKQGINHTLVIQALGQRKEPRSIPALLSYLDYLESLFKQGEATQSDQVFVIKALAQIGTTEILPILETQLREHLQSNYAQDHDIVKCAVEGLQAIGGPIAIEILERAVNMIWLHSNQLVQDAIRQLKQQESEAKQDN